MSVGITTAETSDTISKDPSIVSLPYGWQGISRDRDISPTSTFRRLNRGVDLWIQISGAIGGFKGVLTFDIPDLETRHLDQDKWIEDAEKCVRRIPLFNTEPNYGSLIQALMHVHYKVNQDARDDYQGTVKDELAAFYRLVIAPSQSPPLATTSPAEDTVMISLDASDMEDVPSLISSGSEEEA